MHFIIIIIICNNKSLKVTVRSELGSERMFLSYKDVRHSHGISSRLAFISNKQINICFLAHGWWCYVWRDLSMGSFYFEGVLTDLRFWPKPFLGMLLYSLCADGDISDLRGLF